MARIAQLAAALVVAALVVAVLVDAGITGLLLTTSVAAATPTLVVRVPDLSERTHDEAAVALESLGLRMDPGVEPPDGSTAVVVSQQPVAETEAEIGSAVTPTFGLSSPASTESSPDPVAVPDLSGLTMDQARTAAAARGLRLARAGGDPDGRVFDQDPPAGSLMPPQSVVKVRLRLPHTFVTVPDIVGLTVDDAEQRVESIGLILHADVTRDGRVERQNPRAGTLASTGSVVGVQLATPIRDDSGFPSALLFPAGAALTAAAAAALVQLSRRNAPWVAVHVEVAARDAARTYSVDPTAPRHVARLVPHDDQSQPILEEVGS